MSILNQVYLGVALGCLAITALMVTTIAIRLSMIHDTILAMKEFQEIDPQFRRG